ncbi:hypothetical protein BBJ28_00011068 [Nothophytophthora sp. Chile5]|nr:hypothetical protein BBJ28_00011068 [Nothophytophthora sp. Chile5]
MAGKTLIVGGGLTGAALARLLQDARQAAACASEVAKFEVLDKNRIQVVTSEGKEEIVNALVLTCPIPNSKSFDVSPRELQALKDVTYSQRFAAAYLFDPKSAAQVKALGWTAKYVSNDENDVIRFMCWDHLKKQAGQLAQPTLLVHTSVSFGATFMDDIRHSDEILGVITKSLRKVLPISQVSVPYHDPSGQEGKESPAALVLSRHPRIVVAGDGFLGSNFDSCLLEKLLACIDLWRTQDIDFNPADQDKLEFSIAIGDQSYLLKADSQDDATRWIKGLQARQHRPEGTPSEVFSLRSEHMDAESDASSSEYGGRRPRGASSDNGSVTSGASRQQAGRSSLSYVEAPNPLVPNANAIARSSLSYADAPNPLVPNANAIAAGAKYPMVNTNQHILRPTTTTAAAGKPQDAEVNPEAPNAQCCAPCQIM